MTELVLFLLTGTALLALFLLILWKGPTEESESARGMARLAQMISLPSLSFKNVELLLNDTDYRLLRSSPMLRLVAGQHWSDRRRMVLTWLRLLQRDLVALWRLRRLLSGHGVSTSIGEELRVAETALVALALVCSLRVAVALTGPFALVRVLQSTRRRVETISRSCAGLLARIPSSRWEEIEQLSALEQRIDGTQMQRVG